MAGRWAGLAFTLLCPALALESARILNFAEYERSQSARVEQGLHHLEPIQITLEPESQQHIRIGIERLADLSRPVTPFICPCRSCFPDQCKAPPVRPYPLLPLEASYRNAMQGRPPLEVVRANIEAATEGELSTVEELVARVLGKLDQLDTLRDDELTVLVSNFRTSQTSWVLGIQSLAMDYEEWDEDFLVPQDEQRALRAVFLHVLGDAGYRERGQRAVREFGVMLQKQLNKYVEANVQATTGKFIRRVAKLGTEVLITEEEWVARYDEYVAAMRATLHRIATSAMAQPRDIMPSLETLVAATEDYMDQCICESLPQEKAGFTDFLIKEEEKILEKFPHLRKSIFHKVAYHRWRVLPKNRPGLYDKILALV